MTTELTVDRPYLLERVGDAAIVQVYADGFESLPVRDRILCWHLSQAALAGRDIHYDQRYAHNLEMRAVLEAVIGHPGDTDPSVLAAITHYTKLFWIHTGPFNNLTARKFVLECSPEQFAVAVHNAVRAGAVVPRRDGESLDGLLARLRGPFFDKDFEPVVTNKTPGPGADILASSANNLYVDVTMADLEGFEERYPLNSRLVKTASGLVEEVYRIGGRYAAEITRIVDHLEAAMPYASEAMASALRALVRFYRTGETEDRRAYDIAWVQDQHSTVDTMNGFIEVYMDARGVKGAWEALVYYVHPEKTAAAQAIAAHAQWFEDRMPWDPKYRKPKVTGVTARAIEVVMETGDAGPMTPIGVNLPNDQEIRETHGSKSVSLSNVTEAYEKSTPREYRREFSWSQEEVDRAEAWGAFAGELTTNLHEIIGHGSGLVPPTQNGSPEKALKEHFSAIEEARADLVALYFIDDPYLAAIGIVPPEAQEAIVLAEYEGFARNALVQLRRIREGTQIEEDHMRNRQLIVGWLLANTEALAVGYRDGKTYYRVVNRHAFREGAGRLLAEVQRIKAEGDYDAAGALLETYGVHFDPALRDEIVSRVDTLNLPSYTAFVMPTLTPARDASGQVVDVTISYSRDFTAQMMSWSR
jgi:dipeptidyl-peptidase III